MKNLMDEHKREVKRMRIQKNESLFKSYTPGINSQRSADGPNIFLSHSPEQARRSFISIASPTSDASKEILICDPRDEKDSAKAEQQGSMEEIEL